MTYPTAGALVASRDSNFIFGSLGNGRATLTINGVPVRVLPNGAWIAYLANPPVSLARYEIVAVLGRDTARLVHPVRLIPPRPLLAATGPLVVDSASVAPRAPMTLRADELVRVSVRAPANASVWVRSDSLTHRPLVNAGARPVQTSPSAAPDSTPRRFIGDTLLWATDLPARSLSARAELVVARGLDTARFPLGLITVLPDSTAGWALLGADPGAVSDTDRVIIARPTPGGTYKWFLLPGTQVQVTGRIGESVRVRLDAALEVWVAASDVRALPAGYPAPRRTATDARVAPAEGWADVVIPTGQRPPFLVEEHGNDLVLTLYGTQATTDIIHYARNDSLVRVVTWEPLTGDRARYTVRLATPPFGYLAFWDRGSLVLRVRRAPRVDRARPLRGLTIAVDPGHPPIGSTGPTGLYEPVPALAVGLRLKTLLEARGATVVMTRSSAAAVALGDRPIIARRANAHALVSIHLNALPDGVNPFGAHGTGSYFFHPQAEPLARALQRGMVARMGLRNLGVYYDNLALARPTWMPAVLCEGAFIIIPEQEAALRTPQFQEAYALGVAEGLEAYFRALPATP
ncbi:MAG: N-acetylmuramoyl-L-alanine amidase [Gemmatimonadaceae bacterium]